MRLIDADALKANISSEWLTAQAKRAFYKIIDNAPTVEAVPLEHHNKIKGIMDNEIKSLVDILDNERPQGEWIFDGFCFTTTQYKCNKCKCPTLEKTSFCPNCGTDMRKGGAE